MPIAARLMEAGGILVMLLGPLVSVARSLRLRQAGAASVYRSFRQHLGRAILLGLEFLVAADIIRTVSEVPTLERVVVLAIIVLTWISPERADKLAPRSAWTPPKRLSISTRSRTFIFATAVVVDRGFDLQGDVKDLNGSS